MIRGLISVILPIWKPHINELKTCLDSLISQTHSSTEIIIVYKKSPQFDDAFFLLINGYQDNRIKVIDDKNKGFPGAINEGIINSRGEFIARIDGDDFCEIDRFEKQLKFKKNHKYDIVGTWGFFVSRDGKKIRRMEPPITHQEIRKKMMLRCPIIHSSVLMDRSMLEGLGLYDTSYLSGEDDELWFRAMFKGFKFGNVPEYLVSIRDNPESKTRGTEWRKERIYTIKAKTNAFLRYGFFKPLDVFYFLQTPLYYFISPKTAMKARKILKYNMVEVEKDL